MLVCFLTVLVARVEGERHKKRRIFLVKAETLVLALFVANAS